MVVRYVHVTATTAPVTVIIVLVIATTPALVIATTAMNSLKLK